MFACSQKHSSDSESINSSSTDTLKPASIIDDSGIVSTQNYMTLPVADIVRLDVMIDERSTMANRADIILV